MPNFGGGKCIHGRMICFDCIVIDDAARRAYDTVKLATVALTLDERLGSPWMALRLSDGGGDGTVYDTKRDAVRHQLHERQCAYFCFRNDPAGFANPRQAAVFLEWHRAAYDAGFRLPDPDANHGGHDLIMPIGIEQVRLQFDALGGR